MGAVPRRSRPLANDVFQPSTDEVERARTLLAAYAEAQARGLGAVAVNGDMVDVASVRILRETLRRAELIGL